MDTVNFISTENGDDLIVGFAIASDEPGEIVSLTLLRTPKFEPLLFPEERGVNISRDDIPGSEDDRLQSLRWDGDTVRIATTEGRRYELDMRRVATDERRSAKLVLARMNTDHAFVLEIVAKGTDQGDSGFLA